MVAGVSELVLINLLAVLLHHEEWVGTHRKFDLGLFKLQDLVAHLIGIFQLSNKIIKLTLNLQD